MWSIFGYLIICIIYKWTVDWSKSDLPPPGLLNMLIYMFLQPGTIVDGTKLYSGQGFIQSLLVLIAMVCVPWMLCVKPYVLWKEHQKTVSQGYQGLTLGDNEPARPLLDLEDEEEGAGQAVAHDEDGGDGHGHGFEMSEIIVHQVIHTIEFCLGCISNTASYLRLWALSLAHAQLSEVLYDMTLENAFSDQRGIISGTIVMVFVFGMWFVLSVFILCLMEGLSAFLHALRLIWVEFDSKFYQATGYPFQPLNFNKTEDEPSA
jgi:V-type H+-transporting ATPase subunit a